MLKSGDIMLCKGNDLVARLIKWGTGSDYSHVALVASAELGLIIEAIPKGGVRAIHIDNFITRYDVYRVKDGNVFNLTGVIAYLLTMLARGYDYKSVIKLGWKMFLRKMRLIKLLGLKITHNKQKADTLQKDQDYFCSELCYEAFNTGGGLNIVPEVDQADTVSPADIAKSSCIEKVLQS